MNIVLIRIFHHNLLYIVFFNLYQQTSHLEPVKEWHKWQLRHDSTYISNVNSWDTDPNKSFDFFLNLICIAVVL